MHNNSYTLDNYFDILNTINSEYKCIDINDSEFDNIMKKMINQVKNLSSNNNIKKLLNEEYKNYIKDQLEQNNISLINNFIYYNLKGSDDFDFCKKEVYKVYNFFRKIKYQPEVELIFNLLRENEIFKNLIQSIYMYYKNKNEKIGNSCFSGFLSTTLELYCEIYDVEMLDYEVDNYLNDNKYLRKIKNIPVLTREQERKLFKEFENGNMEARAKIIDSNLRLVPSIANRICKGKVEFLDIVEYGNVGLIEAVDRFDVSRGYRFSTYASWIIMERIIESIHRDKNNIRLCGEVRTLISKYHKFRNEYYSINGFFPSLDEVAEKLNIKKSKIVLIQKYLTNTTSLNQSLFDDNNDEMINCIPDNSINIYKGIESKELKQMIISLFGSAKLTYNETYVIIKRYGLLDNNCKTYNEIACELECTIENARRLEKSALKRMRNCPKILNLLNYSSLSQKEQNEIKKSAMKDKKPIHRVAIRSGIIDVNEDNDPFLMDEYINVLKFIKQLPANDINKLFTDKELSFIYLQLEYLNEKRYPLKELAKILYIDEQTIADYLANILVKLYNYINDGKNYGMVNDVLKVRLLLNRIRT